MAAAAAGAGLGGGGAGRGGGGGAGRAIWGAGFGGGGGVGLAACGGGTTRRISGLGGGGGGGGAGVARFFLCVDSGTTGFTSGLVAEPPVLRSLTAGVSPPGVFGKAPVAGTFGVDAAGDVVAGANFKLGLAVTGAAPDGKGGAPFWPGTGKALVFGKASGVTFVDSGLVEIAPGPAPPLGVVTLTAGLIEALGGTGNLPCWIREAFCATEGGRLGEAADGGVPPAPDRPFAAPAPAPAPVGPAWGGWLITLLMTVVLWMLAKMMLFGGAAT